MGSLADDIKKDAFGYLKTRKVDFKNDMGNQTNNSINKIGNFSILYNITKK